MLRWEQVMTIDSWRDLDDDLAQLLRDWLVADRRWTQVAAENAPASSGLTDQPRA
jgi:hypothetical protein